MAVDKEAEASGNEAMKKTDSLCNSLQLYSALLLAFKLTLHICEGILHELSFGFLDPRQ